MKIFEQAEIAKIAEALHDGALVAVPTETIYGLAVRFDDLRAIEKLRRLKNRGANSGKFFALMLGDFEQIARFAEISDDIEANLRKYLPGEITAVLRKSPGFLNPYYDNFSTIGIRVPKHSFMQALLARTGALIVTSANYESQPPSVNHLGVLHDLPEIDAVVEGESGNQPATTVVDFTTDKPTILRQGGVRLDLDDARGEKS
jgi:L-threonylcarbamoyladenylate synthase